MIIVPEIDQTPGEANAEIDIHNIALKVQESIDSSRDIYNSHQNRSTVKCGEYILSNKQEDDEIIPGRFATVINTSTKEIDQSVKPDVLSKFNFQMYIHLYY